ncbi:MAG: hypothetical protein ACYC23_19275 [Limisphaerales bacterium]
MLVTEGADRNRLLDWLARQLNLHHPPIFPSDNPIRQMLDPLPPELAGRPAVHVGRAGDGPGAKPT